VAQQRAVFMPIRLTVEAKMGMASRIVSNKSYRMPIVGWGVVGCGGCGDVSLGQKKQRLLFSP
jgi:hypothetical protein